MSNSIISVRLETDDKRLISEYAQVFGMSVSQFIRETVLERIEDELDLQMYEAAAKEYEADPVTYTSDEIERKYL
ncbi:MAG: DUF6290 family protein [Coriobacteriales bacterium]|jgi:uncharacterized protein (DUF1778 family)|nr:DUF6290 family protein [Coriobacteriales bacterium]